MSIPLRHAVGQLMIIGFEPAELTPDVRIALRTIQPSGVILFKRNVISAQQTHALVNDCQQLSEQPLFRCVDLEGGTVDRLRDILAPAPAQHDVAATGQPRLFRAFAELLASEARALGFNVDFAPVSDIGFPASHSVLGSRTVSAEPKDTVNFVREFLKGFDKAGVLGCGKHFPGLGEANLDTHHELPAIQKDWKPLWAEDLLPYRELHKQFPFVMIAHCAYPRVTHNNTPASLSRKWMHDILREKIGYNGIILADDLEMGGILAAGGVSDVAVETLRAGADMFLVCRKADFIWEAYESVLRTAERDPKFARDVQRKAAHVLKRKTKHNLSKKLAPAPDESTVSKLRQRIEDFKSQLAASAR